jgi:hypothetical protein
MLCDCWASRRTKPSENTPRAWKSPSDQMPYLLDANVFIQAKNGPYGFKLCPGFWQWIDYNHKAGRVFSIKRVRDEILAREDDLSNWVKTRKSLFLTTDDGKTFESQKLLSGWVVQNYAPAAQAAFMGVADFPLVAHAHAHGFTVVTHEVGTKGAKVKIPDACRALGMTPVGPFEMLNKEGARFVLGNLMSPEDDND